MDRVTDEVSVGVTDNEIHKIVDKVTHLEIHYSNKQSTR